MRPFKFPVFGMVPVKLFPGQARSSQHNDVQLPTSKGSSPLSALENAESCQKFGMLRISGAILEKLHPPRNKNYSCEQLDKDPGMEEPVPSCKLNSEPISVTNDSLPNSMGMPPTRFLYPINKFVSAELLPRDAGIVPVRLLVLRNKYCNCCNWPNS